MKNYEAPIFAVVEIECDDVIATSGMTIVTPEIPINKPSQSSDTWSLM